MKTIERAAVNTIARFPVRLHSKLLFAFIGIVVLQILLGTVGLRVLYAMDERNQELIALQSKIGVYRTVQHDTTRHLYHIAAALLSENERDLEALSRQLNQFGFELDRLELVERDEAELMANVREQYEEFVAIVASTTDVAKGSIQYSVNQFQSGEAQRLAGRLERSINQLVNTATANMLDGINASKRAYNSSRMALATVAVCSILLALGVGYLISLSILRPLSLIRYRLEEIGQGDFERVVEVPNRDELGALVADVNRTSKELGDLYDQLDEQKRYIEELSDQISKYLPRQLYQSIFKGDIGTEIDSRRKHLTVFFSDIRDFSSKTERLEPEALSAVLNCYFSAMTEIAKRHGATIDKFIGDAILAFFGDPSSDGVEQDAERCIRMALEMQNCMPDLRKTFAKYGLFEPLEIRIGINSGHCTVGNFGSTERIDYTIIGTPVNVAARLQEACLPNEILVSRSTKVLTEANFSFGEATSFELKGIANPVVAFQVK